jgi:hypothetical protein
MNDKKEKNIANLVKIPEKEGLIFTIRKNRTTILLNCVLVSAESDSFWML